MIKAGLRIEASFKRTPGINDICRQVQRQLMRNESARFYHHRTRKCFPPKKVTPGDTVGVGSAYCLPCAPPHVSGSAGENRAVVLLSRQHSTPQWLLMQRRQRLDKIEHIDHQPVDLDVFGGEGI